MAKDLRTTPRKRRRRMQRASRPLDLDVPDLIAEVTPELLEEPPKLAVLSLAPQWAAQNEGLACRRWRREELTGRLREKARGFL